MQQQSVHTGKSISNAASLHKKVSFLIFRGNQHKNGCSWKFPLFADPILRSHCTASISMVSQQIRVCFVDIICCIAESERPTMGFADAKCRTCRRIESLQCTHTLRCSRFEARLKFIFNAIVGKRSRVRSPWTNAKVCSFNNNDDEFCTKLNFRQWQSYWNERKTLIKKMCSLCFETAAAAQTGLLFRKICFVLPPVLHEMQVSAIFRKWRTKENLEKEISIERLLQQRSRVVAAWLLNVQ